jgi:ubiquinone/menaquinone biosynthesis C-methylase UbiE
MKFADLQKNWDILGKTDPLWAIYSDPQKKGNKWVLDDFFQTGRDEISSVMTHLKSFKKDITYGKALDFGCGVGRLTQAMAAYFENVSGVDIAVSMIELARKYAAGNRKCDFYLNQKDNLSLFGDSTFDFIYTNVVLQHMEPAYSMRYLSEFLRILRSGGVLFFQLPSELSPVAAFRHRIALLAPNIVRRSYAKIRQNITKSPQIEMYGIKKEKIVKFFNERGAKILDIARDSSASAYWLSYRYCIMKTASL